MTDDPEVIISIYAVFENPDEAPGMFVVRRQDIRRGQDPDEGARYALFVAITPTLEEAREAIDKVAPALYRQPASWGDPPGLVECWF